jgi:hypothetical protein
VGVEPRISKLIVHEARKDYFRKSERKNQMGGIDDEGRIILK